MATVNNLASDSASTTLWPVRETQGRFEAEVTLDAVQLMQSELTPAGPRYTTLYSASLGRPEGH